MLLMKAHIRKVDLIIEVDEHIPYVFFTDPRRLRSILINLTGNAMKFTFTGHVKIVTKFE